MNEAKKSDAFTIGTDAYKRRQQGYLDWYCIDMDAAYRAYINAHAHGRCTEHAIGLAESMPEVCYQKVIARMDNYTRINRLRG
jgi:hypothetical protein